LDLPDRRGTRRRRGRRRLLLRPRHRTDGRRLRPRLHDRAGLQRRPARPRRADLALARRRPSHRSACDASGEVSLTTARFVSGVHMTDLHYATLIEAASAIRSRQVSPVELTQTMLDRIARVDRTLHSYATVTPELAIKQAKVAEAEIAAGKHRG